MRPIPLLAFNGAPDGRQDGPARRPYMGDGSGGPRTRICADTSPDNPIADKE